MNVNAVREPGFVIATYEHMAITDVGPGIEFYAYADRSVQVFGTFGAGGSVLIEGSNDGEHWSALADPQGSPLVFNTAKIEAVLECTRHLRPVVAAGDETTDITVLVFGRNTK